MTETGDSLSLTGSQIHAEHRRLHGVVVGGAPDDSTRHALRSRELKNEHRPIPPLRHASFCSKRFGFWICQQLRASDSKSLLEGNLYFQSLAVVVNLRFLHPASFRWLFRLLLFHLQTRDLFSARDLDALRR